MTTAVFDTLKASRNLKAAGIDEAQADAIVTTMAEAFDDTVATKADVVAIRADLKTEIAAVRSDMTAFKAELKQDIAGLKADFKIVKYIFAPAVILLLLKTAFYS